MTLLVVGSVALDTVETPSERREEILGGSASYFSLVASLITPVKLVAVVGDDFPQAHVDLLDSRGVDLEGLQRETGRTFRWTGRYHANMVDRDTLDTQLNVFESFKPQLPESYRACQYLFLANIDPRLQLDVLNQVQSPDLVALDTMNFWLDGASLDVLKQVLKRTSVVFLNDEEARILSGQTNLVKAAAEVRLLGVDRVVIKRGDAGALLFDDAGPFWAPAYPVEHVVDPTGAGDCFAGGFMAYLAHHGRLDGASVRQAMIFGSATASFAVEGFSVERFENLTREDLVTRCEKFARMVHFERVTLSATA